MKESALGVHLWHWQSALLAPVPAVRASSPAWKVVEQKAALTSHLDTLNKDHAQARESHTLCDLKQITSCSYPSALVTKYNMELKVIPVHRNTVQINLSKIQQKLLIYCWVSLEIQSHSYCCLGMGGLFLAVCLLIGKKPRWIRNTLLFTSVIAFYHFICWLLLITQLPSANMIAYDCSLVLQRASYPFNPFLEAVSFYFLPQNVIFIFGVLSFLIHSELKHTILESMLRF